MNDRHHIVVGKRDGKDWTNVQRIALNQFHRFRRLGFEKAPADVVQKLREEAAAAAAEKKAALQKGGSKKTSKKTSVKGAAGGEGNKDHGGTE